MTSMPPRAPKTAGRIDLATGLVSPNTYPKPRGASWVHESPFLTAGWEEISESGAASLKHMAMRQTLSDQRNLTPAHFATVPWQIARYLWDCLKRSRKQTFYMWKLFATAYPREFRTLSQSRYRAMEIDGPRMVLPDYLELAKSACFDWGVVLSIHTSFARTPDLVEIASVKNLLAMEIFTSDHTWDPWDPESTDHQPLDASVSDRILKSWNELVLSSGAFQHLRVLRLKNQPDLSASGLRYLDTFPSLRVVVLSNCPQVDALRVSGHGQSTSLESWIMSTFSVETAREENGSKVETHSLYGCYQGSFDGDMENAPSIGRDTPILDYRIGAQVEGRRGMRSNSHEEMIILRRRPLGQKAETGPVGKRKQDARESLHCKKRQDKKVRTKQPVMRLQKTKGLSNLLAEFL